MAKPPASASIMPIETLRPLLTLSKKEPLAAAIGLTADGEGLLLLDKKVKPRKALANLRAAAGKAKLALNNASLRFGRAEVDPEYDPGMVRLFVNKDAPGNMRVRLVEVVKLAGYMKVEINIEPALDDETEGEDGGQGVGVPPPGGPTQSAPPPAPPPRNLGQELAQLARRIPEVSDENSPLRAALLKLAGDANTALKASDAGTAAADLDRLRAAIETAAQSAPPRQGGAPSTATPGGPGVQFTKARLAWDQTRKMIRAELQKLEKTVLEETADEPDAAEIAANSGIVYRVLDILDERLIDKLDEALNAEPGPARRARSDEAREIIGEYTDYIARDALLHDIDDNGFIDVAIVSTLTRTLQAIDQQLKHA